MTNGTPETPEVQNTDKTARLTQRMVDTARYEGHAGHRHVLWDAELPGFGLRVYPSGNKVYVLSYRSADKRKHLVTLNHSELMTLDEVRELARREIAHYRLEVVDNTDTQRESNKPPPWPEAKSPGGPRWMGHPVQVGMNSRNTMHSLSRRFIQAHIIRNIPVFTVSVDGHSSEADAVVESIRASCEEGAIHLLYEERNYTGEPRVEMAFVSPTHVVTLEKREDFIEFSLVGTFPGLYETRFKPLLDQLQRKRAGKTGVVHVLSSSRHGGFMFRKLGNPGAAFEEKNYPPKVALEFEAVVRDLTIPSPTGRLMLLSGAPGTGKTYFVRGLLERVKAKWLYVPSDLVGNLGDPAFVSALLNEVSDGEDEYIKPREPCPIVLILEDADECLIPRQADNLSALSSVLNLTDGIMGELLDVRIVATTNVKIDGIDKALTRPGRLSARLEFERLPIGLAEALFLRLTGTVKEGAYTQPTTLATVYADARPFLKKPAERHA